MSTHDEDEDRYLLTLDELEATQERISSYRGLLKELPEIYERKFNERLRPLLDRKQQLIEERAHLLQQLPQPLPFTSESSTWLLPPASSSVEEEREQPSLLRVGALWWLVGLVALGIGVGMHLSRPAVQTPQTAPRAFPSRSLHNPPDPPLQRGLQ